MSPGHPFVNEVFAPPVTHPRPIGRSGSHGAGAGLRVHGAGTGVNGSGTRYAITGHLPSRPIRRGAAPALVAAEAVQREWPRTDGTPFPGGLSRREAQVALWVAPGADRREGRRQAFHLQADGGHTCAAHQSGRGRRPVPESGRRADHLEWAFRPAAPPPPRRHGGVLLFGRRGDSGTSYRGSLTERSIVP